MYPSSSTTPSPSTAKSWTSLIMLAAIYVVAWSGWMLLPGEVSRLVTVGFALLPVRALTALLAWQISKHPLHDRRTSQAWKLLALAFLALLLGDSIRVLNVGGTQIMTLAAVGLSIIFYVAMLSGLLRFPTVLRSSDERERFWLDLGIVMISGGIAIWYFLIRSAPIELTVSLLASSVSLIRPTGDLAILFGTAAILLTTTEKRNQRPSALFILGLLVFFAADLTYGSVALSDLRGTSRAGDFLWIASTCLLFLSFQQTRWKLASAAAPEDKIAVTADSFRLLPYISIAFVYGLLIFSTYRDWINPLGGLIIGAVALTIMVVARQISAVRAHQRAEHLIAKKETRFQSLVQRSSDVITILNPDMTIQFSSPSVGHVFGYAPEQLAGKTLADMIHPADQTRAIAFFTDLLKQPDSAVNIEWRLRHADDTWRYVDNICTNLVSEPTIAGVVLNSLDITSRKEAENKLEHDAFHDSLTGLPNRALFKEYLKTAIARANRDKNHIFAVLFCDLDRFKNINDSLGHTIGDEMLVSVARRLEQSIRQDIDIVARLGGDEFAILLDGMADTSVASHIARRVQEGLRHSVKVCGHEIFSTTSIGIALATAGYSSPEDILRDADTAMYRAKARGRACYEVFDKFMHARAVALLQLENDLRHALERGEFEVYYQPIVTIDDESTITGFEALVRWHHPVRGLVSPTDFISVAEDSGQINYLGKWVLEQACRQMKEWQERYPSYRNLTLSVNLSGKQFLQTNLVEQIREVLNTTGFNPKNLQLEITESVVIENTEIVTDILLQLHELGIQLSMDDFGTGYSSLSYLHNFPIDVLKIDRSFISRQEGKSKSEIVKTIISLARNMGLKVVAEGVETEAQLEHLKDLQCGFGQGFFFSHPVTAIETEELISQTAGNSKRDKSDVAA